MKDILYLDIETDSKGVVRDFGAVYGHSELHERHVSRLSNWIDDANILCGHNIIKHDVPELEKLLDRKISDNKELVDTLLWSPLIFSENPYHKLVKGYKLLNEDTANNPLSDSKLTRTLLHDLLNGFQSAEQSWRETLYYLLKGDRRFAPFFKLVTPIDGGNDAGPIEDLINGKVCSSVDITRFIEWYPVELAYVLALIRVDSSESVLPKWVTMSFPKTLDILDELRLISCSKSSCEYCSEHLDPKKGLHRFFGYSDFRKFDGDGPVSLQEKTVRSGLSDDSFVAVFPTGGGKSLTFQLPALIRGEATGQLTVVISPLVSLMKDQVDNLKDRFSINKAVTLNGLLSPLERQEAIGHVENGLAHILYLSPESLRSPTILKLLEARDVSRFVIDEAHCFSSWGQDFRVDYLYIAEFIKLIQESSRRTIPVSCFTATAKPQVIEDIKGYFSNQLDLDLREFVTRANRSNLSYHVIQVDGDAQKMHQLQKLLLTTPKPAIIYASRTKKVEEVAQALKGFKGFNVTYFHGKLDKEKKKDHMDAFMEGAADIIVATSAFGMGVDKDNVHTVIHYNISDSLENYTQEAGRAGRDSSIKASCYVLFDKKDLGSHFRLLQQTKINRKEIEEIWRAIRSLTKYRKSISLSALEIAKLAGWDTEDYELDTKVKTSIAALEDSGYLRRKQNTSMVFADSLLVASFSSGQKLINAAPMLLEQDRQDCLRVFKRIITDKEVMIDYIADRTEIPIKRVHEVIQILRNIKILGDAKDLTAFVSVLKGKRGSVNILKEFTEIERVLFEELSDYPKTQIALRELNQAIIDKGVRNTSPQRILRILDDWELSKFIQKERLNRDNSIYSITLRDIEALTDEIEWRQDLSKYVLGYLTSIIDTNQSHNKEEVLASFSLIELRDSNTVLDVIQEESLKRYERALLYLNRIKAIKLEGGFMVTYSRLNLKEVKSEQFKRYLVKDYQKLEDHYQQKTEQIHIVGEYASLQSEDYQSAVQFVQDYFTLEYDAFLEKYFKNRIGQIRRPLTPERFNEIIQDLDSSQTKVLNDLQSKNTLVLAGPGAGKTKVLVHKISKLLLMEDVKPEQFLMLTFSKAASLEFKARIRSLVPEYSGLIKISTFHGFCFELIGQMGDLQKSENIIRESIQLLNDGELDSTQISNKSVLLLDEFQDVNRDEWELIKTIISIAGSIKVVAVGDDDQNIYGFRGSSNSYLREFGSDFNAVQYSLVKNYRSIPSIVWFNNEFLKTIQNRMKREELAPVRKELKEGVKLVRYTSGFLMKPTVDSLVTLETTGTRAVLVRTNEEALIVTTLLKAKGLKTRLITGFDSFRTSQLYEMRAFTSSLIKQRSGLVLEEDWNKAFDEFSHKFRGTPHYEACRMVISKFNNAYPSEKLHQQWLEYARDVRLEDVVRPEKDSVIVSTMHKAKGKEFDHVWLMLDGVQIKNDEDRRLIYVALSRAKETLEIHTNSDCFDQLVTSCPMVRDSREFDEPEFYDVVLTLRDINLKSVKYEKASKIIGSLYTDDELVTSNIKFRTGEGLGLGRTANENVLLFSNDFLSRKWSVFYKRGYEMIRAKVEYRVTWFDSKENKEYEVLLPKIRFKRVEE